MTFVLLGSLLLIKPPVRSFGLPINILICIFIALALTSFAPAKLFSWPEWRRQAAQDVLIPLPPTLAPQPWLAAEAVMVLLAGVAWFYLVFETQSRSSLFMADALKLFSHGACRLFCRFDLSLHEGDCVALCRFGCRVWILSKQKPDRACKPASCDAHFPLPVLTMPYRRSYKYMPGWLLCAGVSFAGLLLSNSRGGLGVFLIGLTVWVGVILLLSGSKIKLALWCGHSLDSTGCIRPLWREFAGSASNRRTGRRDGSFIGFPLENTKGRHFHGDDCARFRKWSGQL